MDFLFPHSELGSLVLKTFNYWNEETYSAFADKLIEVIDIHGTTSILPHLDRELAEMRNYLQSLKGSTEKIVQQQMKTHHQIKPLQYHNWGNTAFKTQSHNQPQNPGFLDISQRTTTAQYSTQNISTNQLTHTYQGSRMQQQVPLIQTPTLASPTHSRSVPTTPRNKDLALINQPNFNFTSPRMEQPQMNQDTSLFTNSTLIYSPVTEPQQQLETQKQ